MKKLMFILLFLSISCLAEVNFYPTAVDSSMSEDEKWGITYENWLKLRRVLSKLDEILSGKKVITVKESAQINSYEVLVNPSGKQSQTNLQSFIDEIKSALTGGSTNYIPKWDENLDLINSLISESGTVITIDGQLNTGQGANELYAMNQDVESTDNVTFATIDTGHGANELYAMNQDVKFTDAVTFATINTGQGNYELYAMNQDLETTDSPTFANLTITGGINLTTATVTTSMTVNDLTVVYGINASSGVFSSTITCTALNTGQGNNELYSMNQDVETTDNVTFVTLNTGHGNNELYAMNQDLETTDSPTFKDLTLTNGIVVTTITVSEEINVANLNVTYAITASSCEISSTLDCATINTGNGDVECYAMNQDVESTDNVTFATINTGQGANELYAMNQDVESTDNVTFGRVTFDTGEYIDNPAADELSLYTAGAENLRVDETGDVGINATDRVYLDGVACTGNTYIYERTNDEIDLVAGASPTITVEAGEVGINDTDPGYGLDVNGTARFTGECYFDSDVGVGTTNPTSNNSSTRILEVSGSADCSLVLNESGASSRWEIFAANDDLKFNRNTDTASLFLDGGGGNVGIGTTNPTSNNSSTRILEVSGSADCSLVLNESGASTRWEIFAANDDLKFNRNTDTASLFLDGGGDVGINDETPSYKLDVNGTFRTTGAATFDSTITYSSAQTSYYSVTASDFQTQSLSTDALIYSEIDVQVLTQVDFYAPVNLPHGAVVTSFKVYWYRDDASASGECDLRYGDVSNPDNFPGAPLKMATADSDSTSGSHSVEDTTISAATIDNSDTVYFIHLILDANDDTSDVSFKSAVITYTVTSPVP